MLVITRRPGESIVITVEGQPIKITVTRVDGYQVRIGIEGPRHFHVMRSELKESTVDFNVQPADQDTIRQAKTLPLLRRLRRVRTAYSIDQLRSRFLEILPRIKTHARVYFRHVKCPHKKADYISEVIAIAWKWFVRLAEKGKDACQFASVLASYAARAVRSGRRVCGQLKAKDAMSEIAQQRHGFTVGKLPDFSTLNVNPLAEALTDNTQSAVPDQVQFRCDFPDWLGTYRRRDRTLAVEMAKGERTKALARRFKLSPARVSQLRRQFHDDWEQFTNEEPIAAVAS